MTSTRYHSVSSMGSFASYVASLEGLAREGDLKPAIRFAAALDGEASRELRRAVELPVRKNFGAFFTSTALARRLVYRADPSQIHYDPSCGAGDLLLAVARRLPLRNSLLLTIRHWSMLLNGRDLHLEFIRAAKARLILLARMRGKFTEILEPEVMSASFPGITVGDGLSLRAIPRRAGVIVMNPPYTMVPAPSECTWSTGKINAAALFVEHYVKHSPEGTRVLAILPEVLRTGSSYEKWRNLIEKRVDDLRYSSYGIFDATTDVDVFVLDVVKRNAVKRKKKHWIRVSKANCRLGEKFLVSVGAVVPHRDPKVGPKRRFINSRSAPAFGIVRRLAESRKFDGTVVRPPFVTVKRTSRPGDKHRAIPTLVLGKGQVAVENHLIICRPKNGTLTACRELVRQLQKPEVTEWLNSTMCCRHLTVASVRLLPLS